MHRTQQSYCNCISVLEIANHWFHHSCYTLSVNISLPNSVTQLQSENGVHT